MKINKMKDELKKGKGNGSRKAYNHLINTGIFGVADKIKEARKNGTARRKPRNSK